MFSLVIMECCTPGCAGLETCFWVSQLYVFGAVWFERRNIQISAVNGKMKYSNVSRARLENWVHNTGT